MSTTSKIAVTEGTGAKNLGSYSIAEDGVTKELQRVVPSDSSGTELSPLSATDFDSKIGSLTETAPTTDTASSGLNGRLQRIAQRLTTLIGTTLTVIAGGDIASGSTDSGNPIKIGGVGKTANPTAVTDGQRVNGLFDKLGKQVVVGAIRDLKGIQQTQISNSTSETTIVTAVGSTFLDIYGIILANTGASTTKVTIKDSTSGTTRAIVEVPTLETRGFMLPVDSAIPQAAVNNNWTATCGTATTALEVTVFYVKNI